jgi:hypothetical protein
MGAHPINLAVRFLLELSAYVTLGLWGWHRRDDGFRILIALAIPLFAAVLWGTFAVPNDPSRSGSAPLPVPGILRLALECGFFGFATWALWDLKFARLAVMFGAAVAVHYAISYDRLRWLLEQ